MKRESQSEPTFWPKTGGTLVKLRRRRRRAVLTFSAAAAAAALQLFRRRWRGATAVGLYLKIA